MRREILLVPAGGIKPVDQLAAKDTLNRCQRAKMMWHTREYFCILTCGGVFLPPDIQQTPAAELMRRWFDSHHVPGDRVIAEKESLDTYQNVKYSIDLLKQCGLTDARITVLTDWQHAIRLWITFLSYGIRVKIKTVRHQMSWIERMKEFVFMFVHLIDPRGSWFVGRINRKKRMQKSPSNG
ncbi:MAG: YdcF family protein [Patescibacteria group bacterium]